MAKALSLPVLARAWQMLLRGIDEIRERPDARGAAEMLLLRIACVSDLPSPAELARLLRDGRHGAAAGPHAGRPAPAPPADRHRRPRHRAPLPSRSGQRAGAGPAAGRGPGRRSSPPTSPSFVARLRDGGEAPLAAWL